MVREEKLSVTVGACLSPVVFAVVGKEGKQGEPGISAVIVISLLYGLGPALPSHHSLSAVRDKLLGTAAASCFGLVRSVGENLQGRGCSICVGLLILWDKLQ